MSRPVTVHGHAIVSADDRIADAAGAFPEALRNEADWRVFQAELDGCDFVAIARASHEAAPNLRRRRRLVFSRSVEALEERADAWWWNPQGCDWTSVTAKLLANGGRVGVPGGQAAFDLFAAIGFDSFHLSRAHNVRLPGGRGSFAAVEQGATAEDVLSRVGLAAGESRLIDPAASVSLTVWRRRDAPQG